MCGVMWRGGRILSLSVCVSIWNWNFFKICERLVDILACKGNIVDYVMQVFYMRLDFAIEKCFCR